jgi:hypothetical protein
MAFADPFTSSNAPGADVPMPTFPVESIMKAVVVARVPVDDATTNNGLVLATPLAV